MALGTKGSFSQHWRKVGKFEQSFDMKDCGGQTFLDFMKNKVYGAIKDEAQNSDGGRDHLTAVKNGDGVEVKLTKDITTYHVKYKAADEENAERSGRSYAAVGINRNGVVDYLADASDEFYLSSLEKVAEDEKELEKFYRGILGVITSCDASGFNKMKVETQRVAADFVAVYVAEQYRHLTGGDGDLGPTFNWDDALLQVSLLASFHAGQSSRNGGMFYEGEFTNKVYNQVNYDEDGEKHCFYKQFNDEARENFSRRNAKLADYWQMNRECKRSGINMTRSDFSKMAKAITEYAAENLAKETAAVAKAYGDKKTRDVYTMVSKFYINNDAPADLSDEGANMVDSLVNFLLAVREHADAITTGLKH